MSQYRWLISSSGLIGRFLNLGIFLPDELRDRVVQLNEMLQAKRMEFEEGVAGTRRQASTAHSQ